MTLPNGKVVDGVEIAVDESTERWSDITFKDGIRIRVKMTVVSVHRADDEYDPEGNPMMALNMAPSVAIIEVPESLKKKKAS
jgi:hypothetical protein